MAFLKKLSLTLAILTFISEAGLAQGYTSAPPRKLAPGVITTVRDAYIDDATLDATTEFTELLVRARPPAWTPNFDPTTETLLEKAKRVSFQREVWSLEFGFKSLRVINVGGENIWYLVYFVRNNGEVRVASAEDGKIEIKGSQKPVRFVPSFVLQAHDRQRAYQDRARPDVLNLIAEKERVTRGPLLDSASMSRTPIPVSTPTADRRVWGVAVWDDVDPRADFISVFVHGLTNAYRWQPPEDGYDPGDISEQDVVKSKALQINFWRGGDAIDLNDNEIQLGVPTYPDDPVRQQDVLATYKLEKPVQHRWVYR